MSAAVQKLLTKIFGSRNDRLVKRYRKIVEQINAAEPAVQKLTDEQLRARTLELRTQIVAGKLKLADVLPEALSIIRESMDRNIGIRNVFNSDHAFDPEQMPDSLNEAFNAFADIEDQLIAGQVDWRSVPIPNVIYDAIRKMYPESRPPFRARCFDVQLIGGLVLYEGKIAEMKTGEGKTFVAPLACFLNALSGRHSHVVTVNDYLVKRDANWTRPAFDALGLSVGFIQSEMDPGGETRRKAYQCDVTYGTNSEFGFDYLRDNMRERVDLQVQGPLDFAIVDEVDSVLIDEARTPLIISGLAHDDPERYKAADEVARKIMELHRPCGVIEREIGQLKRELKAVEGEIDKSPKEAKAALLQKQDALKKRLEDADARKADTTAYYEVEMDRKSVHLTHEGIASAQEIAGVGSFYVGDNLDWPHLMEQALRAHAVYERDKDYVVERDTRDGKMGIVIVDEYTGRKMTGRQWSDGLHQAVEAKERVEIRKQTQTVATITLQNFFKLYGKLAGMTGTAQTEAEEFNKIYKLEVVSIPTNRSVIRADHEDRVYRTENEKWEGIIEEIKAYSDAGRPVLVGTTSVEKSEKLSNLLSRKYGIRHEVLNAKQHEREAQIVLIAGQTHTNAHGERVGNVTIATNMAGRGTDIKLAEETQFDVDASGEKYVLTQRVTGKKLEIADEEPLAFVFELSETSKTAGGLHVIGTERHTSRRIDNQLRGRSGRQGDPGSSRFYASLEDDLLKLFMPEWTINVFKKIGLNYGEPIGEMRMLSKSIERAQKKVEERNYLARKNLLEYDEVMDVQRIEFYGMRQRVLEGRDVDQVIWTMIGESINDAVKKYVTEDYVAANVAEWARTEFADFEVAADAADFKGLRKMQDIEEMIRDRARSEIATRLNVTLGEYMGEDRADTRHWHVKDIASLARVRYKIDLPEHVIRKMDAGELEQQLAEAAYAAIDNKDCSPLTRFLEPHFAVKELSAWARDKFDVEIDPEDFLMDVGRDLPKPAAEIARLIVERAHDAYKRREVEYPVDQILTDLFGVGATHAESPQTVPYLMNWVRAKYGIELRPDEIVGQPLEMLRERLFKMQEQALADASVNAEADKLLVGSPSPEQIAERWAARFGQKVDAKQFDPATAMSQKGTREIDRDKSGTVTARDILLNRVRGLVRYELTALEQYVLISIFDQSWKDHLYAMDMLKSGIGLQAFAEKDPRIAFKREGYRYFEEMMVNVRDKVTNLIFKVYVQGQEKPKKSNYTVTETKHVATDSYDVATAVRETAAVVGETTPGAAEPEPTTTSATVVRDLPKLGRNDACPHNTGRKYKSCCGRSRDDGVCDGSGKD